MKPQTGSHAIDIGDLARTYAVIREIGRGGMGAVVLARHREAGHHVAIKIASTDKLDAERLARFSREAYLMARFRHPNIVGLYTVEPIGQGRVGIVMEYVRGQSLARLLSSGKPLSIQSCTRIVRDLGKALAQAHANGVIRRDVKPQNVLVEDATGSAKLADFGIAKVTSDSADVTATGAAMGTPAYMSPEQIDGATLDGRSDIFSLGVLAWEMLAGQRPWAGEPLFKLLYKQKHEALPPVTLFRPDTPVGLQLALEGALAKDTAARWLTMNDMIAQLDEDRPTPAQLARRERETAVLRARNAGTPSDAATVPVRRHAPVAAAAGARTSRGDGEVTLTVASAAGVADASTADHPPPSSPAPSPSVPTWHRMLPFVGGLLFGGVAVVAAFALRSGAPRQRVPDESAGAAMASGALPRGVVETRGRGPSGATERPPVARSQPQRGAVTAEGAAATLVPTGAVVTTPELGGARPVGDAPPPSPPIARRDEVPSLLDTRAAAYALATRARSLVYAGDRADVATLVDSALVLDPRSGSAYALRARLRIASGDVRDAWTDIEMAARTGARWESLALSTMLWARDAGPRTATRRLTGELRDALTPRRLLDADRAVGLAGGLAQAGDTTTALTLLEQADPSDPALAPLLRDPLLRPLHRSARFQRVQARASR